MARLPTFEISADIIRDRSRIRVDKSIEKVMFRLGSLISNQAKINIRNQGMIQTRNLLQSIGFRIDKDSGEFNLVIGAFNNAYAHIVEFGSNNITDRVRKAMFANMREAGIKKKPGKGVIQGNVYRGRSFMGAALDGHSRQFVAFLRDAVREFDLAEKF